MPRLLAALLLVALSSPAAADWTRAQRAQFLGQCIESCRSTAKLPESRLGSYTKAIEGVGVAPDREVRDPLPCVQGTDPILAAGVAALVEQFAAR